MCFNMMVPNRLRRGPVPRMWIWIVVDAQYVTAPESPLNSGQVTKLSVTRCRKMF